MARQPKLILRESSIDEIIKNWNPGEFLETGSGTGYMTKKFLAKGFSGACYELGSEARNKLTTNLQEYGDRIHVLNSLDELKEREFDYLLSFEVLEHIEDDLEALKTWSKHLRAGGTLLISVPAHQKKYGKADAIVGHIRRYERESIQALLLNCGYEDIKIINYGFPISEITRPISNMLINDKQVDNSLSMEVRSTKSSFNRPTNIRKIIDFFGEKWAMPFCKIQRLFYRFDWADGIIVTARKTKD